jgi:hypothetical protein
MALQHQQGSCWRDINLPAVQQRFMLLAHWTCCKLTSAALRHQGSIQGQVQLKRGLTSWSRNLNQQTMKCGAAPSYDNEWEVDDAHEHPDDEKHREDPDG